MSIFGVGQLGFGSSRFTGIGGATVLSSGSPRRLLSPRDGADDGRLECFVSDRIGSGAVSP
jgi:hypothetical protein